MACQLEGAAAEINGVCPARCTEVHLWALVKGKAKRTITSVASDVDSDPGGDSWPGAATRSRQGSPAARAIWYFCTCHFPEECSRSCCRVLSPKGCCELLTSGSTGRHMCFRCLSGATAAGGNACFLCHVGKRALPKSGRWTLQLL